MTPAGRTGTGTLAWQPVGEGVGPTEDDSITFIGSWVQTTRPMSSFLDGELYDKDKDTLVSPFNMFQNRLRGKGTIRTQILYKNNYFK